MKKIKIDSRIHLEFAAVLYGCKYNFFPAIKSTKWHPEMYIVLALSVHAVQKLQTRFI